MMRKATAIIPLAFVARVHAKAFVTSRTGHAQGPAGNLGNNFADELFARALKASPLHHVDLENMTFMKTGHLTLPHRMSLSSPLPARLCPRSTRSDSTSPLVGYRLPMPTELVQASGVGAFRRNFMSATALATLACNFVQSGTPQVVLAASGDPNRVAGQGDEVLVKYTGSFEDGTVFDSSEGKDPLSLIVGGGQVVKGFDNAVRGMKVGEKKKVTLLPDQAYGERDENMVIQVPKSQLPPGLKKGQQIGIGGGMTAVITVVNEDGSIVLDANKPLAGKTLIFDVELSAFKSPPQKGIDMIGWHGKQFQVPFAQANSPVSDVFENPKFPAAWPYKAADFRRQDETTDDQFYNQPRLVAHIDNGFVGAIQSFYDLQFSQAPKGEYSVLDICSSWISHYPEKLGAKRVAITGMNEAELKVNKQATEYTAKDLNTEPKLPYGDNEFDFVTNVVSVDYLNKPQEIFKEMHRVTKPGGVAIMSFSNRCFPSKAISMWVANMNDGPGHCQIIGNYFHFNPDGGWKDISSVDISPNPGRSDPVWVVTAVKA